MASLKEVKGRIATVKNTRKITSAMKMVASAKLHKAQVAITHMLPYKERLHRIFTHFLSKEDVGSIYATEREVKRIALIVISSNSSLCGGYNANVIKHATQLLEKYQYLGKENILVYPIGRKVSEALEKIGYVPQGDFQEMANHPTFAEVAKLAQHLMDLYRTGKVDKVEILYNHFKNMATQILTHDVYLPIPLSGGTEETIHEEIDYIVEPSTKELLSMLLPKVLRMNLYTVLLDSNASEHAARTMAMQIATDNADELLQELTLMYNKTRQQAITNELLDIVGGTMA